jgi:hypothetical protein
MRCINLQAVTTLIVRMVGRGIQLDLFIRRISPIAISHVLNLLSLVLHEELLHSTVLFLSSTWDWWASVVVMHIGGGGNHASDLCRRVARLPDPVR